MVIYSDTNFMCIWVRAKSHAGASLSLFWLLVALHVFMCLQTLPYSGDAHYLAIILVVVLLRPLVSKTIIVYVSLLSL